MSEIRDQGSESDRRYAARDKDGLDYPNRIHPKTSPHAEDDDGFVVEAVLFALEFCYVVED